MARLLKGGAEDGAHATDADDPDVEPGRSLGRRRQITHAGNASASLRHVAFAP